MNIDFEKEFKGLIKYLKNTNRNDVDIEKIINYMTSHGYKYIDYNNVKGIMYLTFDLEPSDYYVVINKDSIDVAYIG